jgi:hypothetical protein
MSHDTSPPKPARDDFGNLVNPIEGRVVERNAGCYSCIHFNTEEAYAKRIESCYTRDVMVFKSGRRASPGLHALDPMPHHLAHRKANETRKLLRAKAGWFGVCTIAATASDFVAKNHLCDKWSGITGANLARSYGEALSPLIEEVYDKRGEIDMIKAKAPVVVPDDDGEPSGAP